MNKSNSSGDICRVIVMCVASSIENLFGGYDGIFFTLIVFISVDYITGICSAFIQKNLSSRKGAIGLIKKFGILCVIAITTLIEKNILHTSALRNAVVLYYISNEGISILENLCKMGVHIPNKLKKTLDNFSEEDEKKK